MKDKYTNYYILDYQSLYNFRKNNLLGDIK